MPITVLLVYFIGYIFCMCLINGSMNKACIDCKEQDYKENAGVSMILGLTSWIVFFIIIVVYIKDDRRKLIYFSLPKIHKYYPRFWNWFVYVLIKSTGIINIFLVVSVFVKREIVEGSILGPLQFVYTILFVSGVLTTLCLKAPKKGDDNLKFEIDVI